MFRFAQQSQALKGRLSSQLAGPVSSWTTHTLSQYQQPFNSRRLTSTEATQNQSNSATSQSIRAAFNSIITPSLNNSPANKKPKNRNDDLSSNSNDTLWTNNVKAFEDTIAQTLLMSRTPKRKNMRESSRAPLSNSNPLFWDSLKTTMDLYYQLRESSELTDLRVSNVIHLLHNGLRANRYQLTHMSKKPDKDSRSFQKQMTQFLSHSLREIANDVLENDLPISEYGAMHLVTAFKELNLNYETVDIWQRAITSSNVNLSSAFLNPRVVGAILPLLYEHGTPYSEIKELYEKSSSLLEYSHPNLAVGMIRASLAARENVEALKIFEELCQNSKDQIYGYLIETHLSFIGNCHDLNIAEKFFNKVIEDDVPYKIDLQVSYVKSFLQNIWDESNDFDYVHRIWVAALKHYGPKVYNGISSSLNQGFFSIFFEKYGNDKVEGFEALKSIIIEYNELKPTDEPFLNIILTKCGVWGDKDIVSFVDDAYRLYHVPKTIITYRILLKTMGGLDDIKVEDILTRWTKLIEVLDSEGQRFIANADWAALRDATLGWAQVKYDLDKSKIESKSLHTSKELGATLNKDEDLDLSHPAFQAASQSGAFDDFEDDLSTSSKEVDISGLQDRATLYLNIVEKYHPYCRDSRQYANLTVVQKENIPILKIVEAKLGNQIPDIANIQIPSLLNLVPKQDKLY